MFSYLSLAKKNDFWITLELYKELTENQLNLERTLKRTQIDASNEQRKHH